MRKRFIALLFIITVACVAAAFGCDSGELKAEFKDYQETIFVNSCVDLEDYIVAVKNADRKLEIIYGGETTEINGSTFYPANSGEHILRYTVIRGKKTASAEKSLTVERKAPEISISDIPFYYEKGFTVNLSALLEISNPFVNPTTAELSVVKASYAKKSVAIEGGKEENSEEEYSLVGEDFFTFEKYGTYTFTVCANDEGKESYAELYAEIMQNNVGNENVKKSEDGVYLSEKAEINGDVVRIGKSEYQSAGYVVLDGEYNEDDVVRVEFKGKNCPNIAMLSSPDNTHAKPYGIYQGKGFMFSLENTYTDKISIWGQTASGGKFGGKNMHNGKLSDTFGRDNLKEDCYYAAEVKLNTAKSEMNVQCYWVSIYEIEGYGTENQSYKLVYSAHGPLGTAGENALGKGEIVFYGSKKSDVIFKICKPVWGYFSPNDSSRVFTKAVYDANKSELSASMPFLSITENNYLATSAKYGSGAYVRVDFKGEFFPGRILFGVEEAVKTATDTVGIGWDLDNENFNADVYYKPDGQTEANRRAAFVAGGKLARILRNDMSFKEKNFTVIAGAIQSGSDVVLEYYLYVRNEDGSVTPFDRGSAIIKNAVLNKGRIVVTSSIISGVKSEIAVRSPATKNELTEALYSENSAGKGTEVGKAWPDAWTALKNQISSLRGIIR